MSWVVHRVCIIIFHNSFCVVSTVFVRSGWPFRRLFTDRVPSGPTTVPRQSLTAAPSSVHPSSSDAGCAVRVAVWNRTARHGNAIRKRKRTASQYQIRVRQVPLDVFARSMPSRGRDSITRREMDCAEIGPCPVSPPCELIIVF